MLLLFLAVFLCLSPASGSHFRGGTVSWTRSSSTSREITFKVVMHFYTGGIFPRWWDVRLRYGDGTSNRPSSATGFLNGTWDSTGEVRTIIYYETKTYPGDQVYIAYIESNARQHAIINGPDRPYRVEAGVDLTSPSCLGSPAGIIPGVTYLGISEEASFQISATTTSAQALQYSWYGSSRLNLNPPVAPAGAAASTAPAAPSYSGVLVNWDTSSGTAGSLYAVSVRADVIGEANCHAVWDVTVQLEDVSVPFCESGGGAYTLFTTQSASYTFVGADPAGDSLTAALIGNAPPGSTFSNLAGASNVTMDWGSPVSGSYAFSVQFCNSGGICGACSVSINVNDALPQIEATSTATANDDGTVTIETIVDNTSIGVQTVTVQEVASSLDGDLTTFGCLVGVDILAGGDAYNCTYASPSSSEGGTNTISVQVVANDGGAASLAGESVPVELPTTTSGVTESTQAASTGDSGTGSPGTGSPGTGGGGGGGGGGGSGSSSSSSTSPTTDPIVTISPLLIPQACGALQLDRCTEDSDCGSGLQPGLCTVDGFCECGVGYQGVGTNLDPTGCEFVCTPPPVNDSVAFLNEPIVDSYAEQGDLVLRVSIDPNLKQQPTSIRMVNPTTGAVCGILPEKLGLCVLTQEVNPDNCWTEYMWRHTTFYDAVLNSGCFIELPNVTESGPGFTVISRAFKTIYEVELSGYAPFGQDATKKRSETVLTRILRREYTYIVATQLLVESNDFAVVADGLIQYRLVGIDVAPTDNQVKIRVQTRVIAGGRVAPARVNATLTTGLPNLVRNVQLSPCLASSPANFCDQYHDVTFELNPCSASGELVLNCGLNCEEDGIDDPVDCGFINVPIGNKYTLDNLLINYDACPVTTSYGIDASNSFVRVYEDSARTQPVALALGQNSTTYGRVAVATRTDSTFQTVTLSALNLWQAGSPNNINLGDQLSTASSFFSLASPPVSTDPFTAIFNFEAVVSFPVFQIGSTYFWEAVVDIVFLETGALTKKRFRVMFDHRGQEIRRMQDRNEVSDNRDREGIFSNTFRMEDRTAVVPPQVATGTMVPVIAGVVVGVALTVGCIVLVMLIRKRTKKSKLECADQPALQDISFVK